MKVNRGKIVFTKSDYSMLNQDRSNVIEVFRSVEAASGVAFFLATKDPYGNPTTGFYLGQRD
jgi:hypothetical protein